MREYSVTMQEEKVLCKVICNGCGREIPLIVPIISMEKKHGGIFPNRTADRIALTFVRTVIIN